MSQGRPPNGVIERKMLNDGDKRSVRQNDGGELSRQNIQDKATVHYGKAPSCGKQRIRPETLARNLFSRTLYATLGASVYLLGDRQWCKILSKVGNGVSFVFLKAPYDGKIEAKPLKGTITAIKQTVSVRTNPHWKRQREYCCDNPEVDVPEDQNEGGKTD